MQSIKLSCGGGMTSSTISVNFNDTAQKTVFTATEKCILKLSMTRGSGSINNATMKLNNEEGDLCEINSYTGAFDSLSRRNPKVLSFMAISGNSAYPPSALVLYLEEGDTVYATRTSSNAFTLSLYSAVFTF